MKKILVIVLLSLCVYSYGSIYSNFTNKVPENYDNMACEPININDKTSIKVMHSNNELYIGLNCLDKITNADMEVYTKENPNYDKNRVEISLCEKDNQGNFLEYIIYPGGIIYDAQNNNSLFKNKYKVYPRISDNYWNFVLIVDRKILSESPKNYDDWEIKITRQSKDQLFKGNWEDLYWTSDENCFKAYENKKNLKIANINKNLDYIPASVQYKVKEYLKEIDQISKNQTRESVNKIRDIFNKIDKLNTYSIGANQQKEILKLQETLPFMFSFVECGPKYNTKRLITYKNKTSFDFDAQVGEEIVFGLMFSPYEDMENLNISYEGVNIAQMGEAKERDNIIDFYEFTCENKIDLKNIKAGENRLILVKIKPKYDGESKSNIVVNSKNSIKLPININVYNYKLQNQDKVIASSHSDFVNDTNLETISNFCSFLVENNIYSVSLDFANCDYWFDFKQNKFGKYETNNRNFDLAVKTIFLSGIKNIYIEPLKNMDDEYRLRAFAKEIINYNNLENIYMMISENNKSSKLYKDYINILKGKIKLAYEDEMFIKDYSIYDNNIAIRQDLCKLFLDGDKDKFIVDCSNSENSLLYNKIPSLRFKELKEAITDISYLSLLKDKISENKKLNKSYNEGEVFLQQFMDLQLVKAPELLTDSEFNSMRSKTIQFLNK